MGIVSQRLRDSAKGQPCTLRASFRCECDRSTTVLAHLPSEVKGVGNKSDDFHAVFACNFCHEALDQHEIPEHLREWYMLRALRETLKIWIEEGYLTIAGDKERKPRPPSTKSLPPKPSWRFNRD